MKLNCGLTKETKLKNKREKEQEKKRAYSEALNEKAEFLKEWHTWYAWRPVKIKDNDCRLFEEVEGRYPDAHTKYDYGEETWIIVFPCKVEYRSKT